MPVANQFLFLLAMLAMTTNVFAVSACYGGPACGAGHGCCDCSLTQSQCTTGTWSSSCTASMCATGTKPAVNGCYSHPAGCDCSVSQSACTGTWYADCFGDGTGCGVPAAAEPPSPPSPPPAPPSPPPAPPQACIVKEGQEQPKTTAAFAKPVNEPCYSHSSCKKYGNPSLGGYICCVAVGTCDTPYVSNTPRYYQGGCIGLNYKSKNSDGSFNMSKISAEAAAAGLTTVEDKPSVVSGCVVQGECNVPFLEQMKKWSSIGSHLNQSQVPDVAMDRLLAGVTETYPGACRDIYPYNKGTDAYKISTAVIASGSVDDYTPTVINEIERKVAHQMGRNVDEVTVTVTAGSVLLEINILYPSNTTAVAGMAAMASAMNTNADAATMLSTYAMNLTVTDKAPLTLLDKADTTKAYKVTYSVPVNGTGLSAVLSSPPSAPPPSAPPEAPPSAPPPTLSVGGIAGIAVGATVFVVIIVVVVVVMMKKKKSTVKTVG